MHSTLFYWLRNVIGQQEPLGALLLVNHKYTDMQTFRNTRENKVLGEKKKVNIYVPSNFSQQKENNQLSFFLFFLFLTRVGE